MNSNVKDMAYVKFQIMVIMKNILDILKMMKEMVKVYIFTNQNHYLIGNN